MVCYSIKLLMSNTELRKQFSVESARGQRYKLIALIVCLKRWFDILQLRSKARFNWLKDRLFVGAERPFQVCARGWPSNKVLGSRPPKSASWIQSRVLLSCSERVWCSRCRWVSSTRIRHHFHAIDYQYKPEPTTADTVEANPNRTIKISAPSF